MKDVNDMILDIKADACEHFCQWPNVYDEEAEGIPLADSRHCMNCPLDRLERLLNEQNGKE